jgi:PTH1 family peptidyl-tRNA hydrolase
MKCTFLPRLLLIFACCFAKFFIVMKFLIAGLGNIGPEYELTRHNIGFLVADQLADKYQAEFSLSRHAYLANISHKGRQLYLIKPTTFMNLSGKAVNYWLKELKVPIENLLVITDDLALPFGKLRLRTKGSHGGQNGLRNIEEMLGTQEFTRLRFGIGSDFPKGRQVAYVLSQFSADEFASLSLHTDKACEGILAFCTLGPDMAMNLVNA